MLNQKEKLLYEEILNDEYELEKMIQILKLVTETAKKNVVSHRSTFILMSSEVVDI